MGEVYLAQHPRLPRQDALKVLRAEFSSDEEFRQRFIQEADLAASLSHPNIVKVHDRGEYEGQLWIATEFVDGIDAGELLRERFPEGMPVEEACAITTGIAAALDHAHERGLLHRDVKPANILLAKPDRYGQRQAYLADFGVARPLADSNGLTATNLTVGTVAYAAPEQLMGEAIDGRADEYALAATAFHLLSGKTLYQNTNPVAVISSHLNAPAPKLSDHRPDLANLDAVIDKALAKDPAERFDSCNRFAKALSGGTGSPLTGPPTDVGPTLAAPLASESNHPLSGASPQRTRRRPILIGLAAAIAVAALVAAGVHYMNRKPAAVAVGGSPSIGSQEIPGIASGGSAASAPDSSSYKAEVVSSTQIGDSLNVVVRNPNPDVGLVRSPFELAMLDEKGAVVANVGNEGMPGSAISTIYQLPPNGEFGLALNVPPGRKVSSVELTITGEWLQWATVDAPTLAVSEAAVMPDSGSPYSGPSITGRVTLDRDGPFNVVVTALVKTPVGTVISNVSVDCMRSGQRRAFETKSFDDVRGPYELQSINAYPTSIKGAGPQYTPTC